MPVRHLRIGILRQAPCLALVATVDYWKSNIRLMSSLQAIQPSTELVKDVTCEKCRDWIRENARQYNRARRLKFWE